MLGTCKETHSERHQIFYHHNAFILVLEGNSEYPPLLLRRWLTRIGPIKRSFLRRLHATITNDSGALVLDAEAPLSP